MRTQQYFEAKRELTSVLDTETDYIAALANTCAILKAHLNFFWIGFYRVQPTPHTNVDELVLGPFQGSVACTRIAYGKGVCGTAWKEEKTIRVADVHQFEGHIACSHLSNSEIVIPIRSHKTQKIIAVLDIDSIKYNDFSEQDQIELEKIAMIIANKF